MNPGIYEPSAREERELNELLEDRLYEFNAAATGIRDARFLAGVVRNAAGEIVGAVKGHTWGGCCYVSHLWVHEPERRRGLGQSLLQAAEREAADRGCGQVVLSTHSFQAPRFYERLGYARVGTVADYPRGHSSYVYAKSLKTNS
jgi:ribosomal protein S18 acetylase RimI-like enzyme